ncbi:MAG: creatininase family protein [Saprospiraceae bacterium]|nr:creatininase family protein [Saprospiraceae bacterium]
MTGSIGHHPGPFYWRKKILSWLSFATLTRLEAFKVKLAVVFTGHFGKRQLAALNVLKTQWAAEKHDMRLLVLSINQCPDAKMIGDHGAIFETSVLSLLHPELVKLDKLPPQETNPANDPDGDSWGPHRRDSANVLFGILGDDPRAYDDQRAKELLSTILDWMISKVSYV